MSCRAFAAGAAATLLLGLALLALVAYAPPIITGAAVPLIGCGWLVVIQAIRRRRRRRIAKASATPAKRRDPPGK